MSGPIDELDDGRVVADMSEVGRPSLLLPRWGASKERDAADEGAAPAGPPAQLDRSERRAMLRGALSAGLLIVLIFALAFALLIVLLLKVWG